LAWYGFRPYVSVAARRLLAAREIDKRKKKGLSPEPVTVEGRAIARSFWGKAWCDHLEGYSDYENRLPRGRTYVRNGSVVHLAVGPGRIDALVQGTSLYEVGIDVTALDAKKWTRIVGACSGQIDSMIELLRGQLSDGVMRVVTDQANGLFPAPSQIRFDCSCPDWASMCKHVAAVLYGIGARFDARPELLFLLRKVDHVELVAAGVKARRPAARGGARALSTRELEGVFGIELESPQAASPAKRAPAKKRKKGRAGMR
jgi:uncharacterized Zn finger protein